MHLLLNDLVVIYLAKFSTTGKLFREQPFKSIQKVVTLDKN